MKLNRTTGKAAGAGVGVIATLLLALTFIVGNDQVDTLPALEPPTTTAPVSGAATPTPEPTPITSGSPAAAMLAEISTTTKAPEDPYDRDLFGQRWADVDRNGCDTRNDMLARDLVDPTFKAGTHDCVVLTGTLHDPYTGETVTFTRVSEGYQPVQVDHIISLDAAWATGAAEWNDQKRLQFANDPLNLLITIANQSKGERTPSSWMPATPHAACYYATRYVDVAHTYELALAAADIDALSAALTGCTQ